MSGRLSDKTVVVLGASASGGSGWRVAEAFAQEGAHVVVAARSLDKAAGLAARIGGTALRCDAAIDEDVAELARIAAGRSSGIDAAVYAAGAAFQGSIAETHRSRLEKSFGVNFLGAFAFVREMCAHMPSGGAVTLISSMSSTHVFPGLAPYGMAKAALNALVRYAAVEFAPSGIRINGVVPGLIDTPMAEPLLSVAREQLTREIPLGRPARPEEIAAMCLFLTMDAPSITGALIPLDGGNHLRRAVFPDEMPPA